MPPSTRALALAAAGAYAANCALGTAVALRALDTSGYRWVHHALYIVTVATTSLAALAGLQRRSAPGLAVAPALLPLAFLPFLGHEVHATTALAAAPWYVGSLLVHEGR